MHLCRLYCVRTTRVQRCLLASVASPPPTPLLLTEQHHRARVQHQLPRPGQGPWPGGVTGAWQGEARRAGAGQGANFHAALRCAALQASPCAGSRSLLPSVAVTHARSTNPAALRYPTCACCCCCGAGPVRARGAGRRAGALWRQRLPGAGPHAGRVHQRGRRRHGQQDQGGPGQGGWGLCAGLGGGKGEGWVHACMCRPAHHAAWSPVSGRGTMCHSAAAGPSHRCLLPPRVSLTAAAGRSHISVVQFTDVAPCAPSCSLLLCAGRQLCGDWLRQDWHCVPERLVTRRAAKGCAAYVVLRIRCKLESLRGEESVMLLLTATRI